MRLASLLCAAALVLTSALTVIYSQHQSREMVAELQRQYRLRDDLDIEWNRLLLEHSTWATHARIEQLAREQLGMHAPSLAETGIVQP